MYDSDLGGFLVVLVIRRCVNTTEANMEMAHSVKKMGVKLTQVWDAKLNWDCLLLLTLIPPGAQMWMATFIEEDGTSIIPLIAHHAGEEKTR